LHVTYNKNNNLLSPWLRHCLMSLTELLFLFSNCFVALVYNTIYQTTKKFTLITVVHTDH